jgi:predicted esterase
MRPVGAWLALVGSFLFACGGAPDEGPSAGASNEDPAPAPPEKTTTGAPVGGEAAPRRAEYAPGARTGSLGAPGGGTSGGGTSSGGVPSDPYGGAGAPPTATCTVTKDASGFFTRTSSKGPYVAYVPKSYAPTSPMRLVVGVHGCGDTAYNFATWAVNPYDTRATQQHIGISVGGETGSGACWNVAADEAKVLAAIDDISKCFWVHQKKVVLAGYSSGGILAYHLGLTNASRFAGILIENSGLYPAGDATTLLAAASWKINITHRAHSNDTVFPLAKVQADWTKITSAGHPLASSVVAGTHDGSSADWATYLLPSSASWTSP